jgi:hypothetical protein
MPKARNGGNHDRRVRERAILARERSQVVRAKSEGVHEAARQALLRARDAVSESRAPRATAREVVKKLRPREPGRK